MKESYGYEVCWLLPLSENRNNSVASAFQWRNKHRAPAFVPRYLHIDAAIHRAGSYCVALPCSCAKHPTPMLATEDVLAVTAVPTRLAQPRARATPLHMCASFLRLVAFRCGFPLWLRTGRSECSGGVGYQTKHAHVHPGSRLRAESRIEEDARALRSETVQLQLSCVSLVPLPPREGIACWICTLQRCLAASVARRGTPEPSTPQCNSPADSILGLKAALVIRNHARRVLVQTVKVCLILK